MSHRLQQIQGLMKRTLEAVPQLQEESLTTGDVSRVAQAEQTLQRLNKAAQDELGRLQQEPSGGRPQPAPLFPMEQIRGELERPLPDQAPAEDVLDEALRDASVPFSGLPRQQAARASAEALIAIKPRKLSAFKQAEAPLVALAALSPAAALTLQNIRGGKLSPTQAAQDLEDVATSIDPGQSLGRLGTAGPRLRELQRAAGQLRASAQQEAAIPSMVQALPEIRTAFSQEELAKLPVTERVRIPGGEQAEVEAALGEAGLPAPQAVPPEAEQAAPSSSENVVAQAQKAVESPETPLDQEIQARYKALGLDRDPNIASDFWSFLGLVLNALAFGPATVAREAGRARERLEGQRLEAAAGVIGERAGARRASLATEKARGAQEFQARQFGVRELGRAAAGERGQIDAQIAAIQRRLDRIARSPDYDPSKPSEEEITLTTSLNGLLAKRQRIGASGLQSGTLESDLEATLDALTGE